MVQVDRFRITVYNVATMSTIRNVGVVYYLLLVCVESMERIIEMKPWSLMVNLKRSYWPTGALSLISFAHGLAANWLSRGCKVLSYS